MAILLFAVVLPDRQSQHAPSGSDIHIPVKSGRVPPAREHLSGLYDQMIVGHVRSRDWSSPTNNLREFGIPVSESKTGATSASDVIPGFKLFRI